MTAANKEHYLAVKAAMARRRRANMTPEQKQVVAERARVRRLAQKARESQLAEVSSPPDFTNRPRVVPVVTIAELQGVA